MAAEPERPPGAWRQMWLRIRYAEYVGTRLTREGARSFLPVVIGAFGTTALFGVFLAAALMDGNLPLALVSVVFLLLLLFLGVAGLRVLIGYHRPDRYPVVLDLWSDRGLTPGREAYGSSAGRPVLWSEPAHEPPRRSVFQRIEAGFSTVFYWFCAVFMWFVSAVLLVGMFTGDFPQGPSGAG